jgi:hypothetical protein
MHHRVSLETIANETKVPIALWEGLEDNNLAGWPRGIYARAYVREYAALIGVDPDETVDEFCRLFPEGDRRQARLLHEHAAIVGHQLAWSDNLRVPDRRTPSASASSPSSSNATARRVAAALMDGGMVFLFACIAGVAAPVAIATRVVVVAIAYYAIHVISGGQTPALRVIDAYLEHSDSRDTPSRRMRSLLQPGKRSEDPNRGIS